MSTTSAPSALSTAGAGSTGKKPVGAASGATAAAADAGASGGFGLAVPRSSLTATPLIAPRASLGLAVFPDHGDDRDTLLMNADVAMYAAKRDGGGVKVYAANDVDAANAQAAARATASE